MRQLDLVYNTFVNLEKNYAKSKKSREEYLKDKFGGDISVGAFLILNALGAEEFTDPEDIEKLSKVRDIFDDILANKDNLSELASFDFDTNNTRNLLFAALNASQASGFGYTVIDQQHLYKKKDALHYHITPKETLVVPLLHARYTRVFSKAIASYVAHITGVVHETGTLLESRSGGRIAPVTKPKF